MDDITVSPSQLAPLLHTICRMMRPLSLQVCTQRNQMDPWPEPRTSPNQSWISTLISWCLLLCWGCTLNSNYWAVKDLKDYLNVFYCSQVFHKKVSQTEILEHPPPYLLISDVQSSYKAWLCGLVLVSAQYLYCTVPCFITRNAKISEVTPRPRAIV